MSTELDELLRTMPRERAPETFARDVVARLDSRPPKTRPLRLVFAGAATALALVVGAAWWSRSAAESELRTEITALREQHQVLEDQLAALRQRLAAQEPLVLGGTDRVDYVVDLDRLSDFAAPRGEEEAIWVPQPAGGSL